MTAGLCPSDLRVDWARLTRARVDRPGLFLMALGVTWLAPRYFPSES